MEVENAGIRSEMMRFRSRAPAPDVDENASPTDFPTLDKTSGLAEMPARDEQIAPKVPRIPRDVNRPGMEVRRFLFFVWRYLTKYQTRTIMSTVRIPPFHQFAQGINVLKKSLI